MQSDCAVFVLINIVYHLTFWHGLLENVGTHTQCFVVTWLVASRSSYNVAYIVLVYFLATVVVVDGIQAAHDHLGGDLRVNVVLRLVSVGQYLRHLLLVLPLSILFNLTRTRGEVHLCRVFNIFIILFVYHHALRWYQSRSSQFKYLLCWIPIGIVCHLLSRGPFHVSEVALALLAAQVLPVLGHLRYLSQTLLGILIDRVRHYSVVTRLLRYLLGSISLGNMVFIATENPFFVNLHLETFLINFGSVDLNFGRFHNLTYILFT